MKQNTMVYNKVLITIFRNFKENNKSYSKTTNILMILAYYFVLIRYCYFKFYLYDFVYCDIDIDKSMILCLSYCLLKLFCLSLSSSSIYCTSSNSRMRADKWRY